MAKQTTDRGAPRRIQILTTQTMRNPEIPKGMEGPKQEQLKKAAEKREALKKYIDMTDALTDMKKAERTLKKGDATVEEISVARSSAMDHDETLVDMQSKPEYKEALVDSQRRRLAKLATSITTDENDPGMRRPDSYTELA